MGYVDSAYYTNTYKGAVPSEALTPLLEKASDSIDQLTYFRIKAAGGLANLTVFQQDMVKKAVCAQIDFLYENDVQGLPEGVQSYSVNGVSVSFGQSGIGPGKFSTDAVNYLTPTGLRYGGW